jgi:hypothetical protein
MTRIFDAGSVPATITWPADQPFLFFVNPQTGHGNLIYHGYDGHYGLIGSAD